MEKCCQLFENYRAIGEPRMEGMTRDPAGRSKPSRCLTNGNFRNVDDTSTSASKSASDRKVKVLANGVA